MPNKLVFLKAALGTGKVVCLQNLWLSKLLYAVSCFRRLKLLRCFRQAVCLRNLWLSKLL